MAEILAEILRNTQNFGRNSEEKIGLWSLCLEEEAKVVVGAGYPNLKTACISDYHVIIRASSNKTNFTNKTTKARAMAIQN